MFRSLPLLRRLATGGSGGSTGRLAPVIRSTTGGVETSSAAPTSVASSDTAPWTRSAKQAKPIVAASTDGDTDSSLGGARDAVADEPAALSARVETPCPCCFGVVHKSRGHFVDPALRPYFRSFSSTTAAGASGSSARARSSGGSSHGPTAGGVGTKIANATASVIDKDRDAVRDATQ